jgi:hypothetical protein
MTSHPTSAALEVAVEALAACGRRAERDQVLLHSLLRCGVADAAALWRWHEPDLESGRAGTWHCVRAVGRADALPADALLASYADSAPETPLPAGLVRLCVQPACAGAPQLFLAGCEADSEQTDLAEALFLVWRASDQEDLQGFLDVNAPLLPGARAPRADRATHAELLGSADAPSRCALKAQLEDTLHNVTAQLREVGIEVSVDLNELPPEQCAALDPGELRHLLEDLLAQMRHTADCTSPTRARIAAWPSRGPAGGSVLLLEVLPAPPSKTAAVEKLEQKDDRSREQRQAPDAPVGALGQGRCDTRPDGGLRWQVWLPQP